MRCWEQLQQHLLACRACVVFCACSFVAPNMQWDDLVVCRVLVLTWLSLTYVLMLHCVLPLPSHPAGRHSAA